jgi:uracil-DNA glycosylase family 4
MIERELRNHYLRSLGVEVWERRADAPESSPAKAPSPADLHSVALEKPVVPPHAARAVERPSGTATGVAAFGWPELESAVKACRLCDLNKTRTQTVFGVGNRTAEWMVIGEAPGADEDAQGEPFVGRAGQLLNSMLKACGLKREHVFIANILKCRPPQNRDPTPNEAACCTPYLQRQIELVNPKLILCVGRIAAQNLLNTDTPIGKLRGQVHRLGSAGRPVVVTYHPAYLLRSPGEKRRAWDDLLLAMATAPLAAE